MGERKFIRFENTGNDVYNVFNHKNDYLGYIYFYDEWKTHKQFVFCPGIDTFFTAGCLLEIIEKLKELNKNG